MFRHTLQKWKKWYPNIIIHNINAIGLVPYYLIYFIYSWKTKYSVHSVDQLTFRKTNYYKNSKKNEKKLDIKLIKINTWYWKREGWKAASFFWLELFNGAKNHEFVYSKTCPMITRAAEISFKSTNKYAKLKKLFKKIQY